MKLRYLAILGVLVFFNGFVFTVFLLMASREFARPAATPTGLSIATATNAPAPSPTNTGVPLPTATRTRAPVPTSTMVIVEPTVTQTLPPATATVSTPTATSPPVAPTATGVPSTATPTSTPTSTPTATATTPWSYEFRYAGGMQSEPKCDPVNFEGKITGVGGEPVDGRTVRLRFGGQVPVYRVSGYGEPPGEWGFAPLAPENVHSPFTFEIDVVDSAANPEPRSDTVVIEFTDCSVAGHFTNIVFVYAK